MSGIENNSQIQRAENVALSKIRTGKAPDIHQEHSRMEGIAFRLGYRDVIGKMTEKSGAIDLNRMDFQQKKELILLMRMAGVPEVGKGGACWGKHVDKKGIPRPIQDYSTKELNEHIKTFRNKMINALEGQKHSFTFGSGDREQHNADLDQAIEFFKSMNSGSKLDDLTLKCMRTRAFTENLEVGNNIEFRSGIRYHLASGALGDAGFLDPFNLLGAALAKNIIKSLARKAGNELLKGMEPNVPVLNIVATRGVRPGETITREIAGKVDPLTNRAYRILKTEAARNPALDKLLKSLPKNVETSKNKVLDQLVRYSESRGIKFENLEAANRFFVNSFLK